MMIFGGIIIIIIILRSLILLFRGQIVGSFLLFSHLRLLLLALVVIEFVCHGLCVGGKGGRGLASAWSLRIIELLMAVFDRFRLSCGGVGRRRIHHNDVLTLLVHLEHIALLLLYFPINHHASRFSGVEGRSGPRIRRNRVKRSRLGYLLCIRGSSRIAPTFGPKRPHTRLVSAIGCFDLQSIVDLGGVSRNYLLLEGVLAISVGLICEIFRFLVDVVEDVGLELLSGARHGHWDSNCRVSPTDKFMGIFVILSFL